MSPPSPSRSDIPTLAEAAKAARSCTACELYLNAEQVVFGEGPTSAGLMLLGEQPGDQEDRQGHPFVGPAGRELDRALEEAGIGRSGVYVSNVVKHFRFEERGKKRLHKKPARRHIEACRPWLEIELARVAPEVIVCLGGSAAEGILGRPVRVMSERGVPVEWEEYLVMPTIHPSFILRTRDDAVRRERFGLLVQDLKAALQLAADS